MFIEVVRDLSESEKYGRAKQYYMLAFYDFDTSYIYIIRTFVTSFYFYFAFKFICIAHFYDMIYTLCLFAFHFLCFSV